MKRFSPVPGRVYPGGRPNPYAALERMIAEAKANGEETIRLRGRMVGPDAPGGTPEERARAEKQRGRMEGRIRSEWEAVARSHGVEIEWLDGEGGEEAEPPAEEATFRDWAKLSEEGEALVRAEAEKLTPASAKRLPRGWWREGEVLTFALRHWVVREGSVCPLCRRMYEGNGWRRKGQRFTDPDTGEPYDGPPRHPYCRCDTMTVTVTVDAEALAARR